MSDGTHTLGRHPEQDDDRPEIGARWLVRLRWGAATLLAACLGGALLWLDTSIAIVLPATLLAVTIATNLWLSARVSRAVDPRPTCGAMLAVDTVVLTGVLAATGGPWNPFSILYLVYITLSAVLLGSRWTWALALLSIGCFGALFPLAGHSHDDPAVTAFHLHGMWVAFTLAAVLTAYFVTSLADALARRDVELAEARERAVRSERLAAVTTLAAGAAHELSTPLATIAVVAHEMARKIGPAPSSAGASAMVEDADLIGKEVDRCRDILDRMSADFGELDGEAAVPVGVDELIEEVARRISEAAWARVHVDRDATAERTVRVPRHAFGIAVANLVRNALDASDPELAVTLRIAADAERLLVEVRDRGPGMPPKVLVHAVEPFFTTKEPGHGMGLGLFLSHTLAERLGGQLRLRSEPGHGVVAALEVPLAPSRA